MKLFECQHCGQPLYFENTRCESCGRDLGYLPSHETITALEQGNRGLRALAERKGRYRYCANCAIRRLQLACLGGQPRAVLRRLPPQPDDPRPVRRRQSGELEADRDRQAPAVLHAAQAPAAAADQARGSGARAGVRFPGRAAAERRAGRAGADRARQRPHHHQPRRGRRCRTRAHAPADARAVPDPARPFPPRDRALLLGPAGARRARHRGVPAIVRRRARGLRRGAAAALRQRAAAGLAGAFRHRLCQHASVGGLGRDLGALLPHGRHAGDRVGVRHAGSPARDQGRRPFDRDRLRSARRRRWIASSTPGCR